MSPVFRHGGLRLYLLKLLDEAPRHGYDVIRLLQDKFLGVYSPSPGTIYPRLARLEEEGLVTHETVDGKKIYRITDAGRAELNRRLDDLADLEDELAASVRDIAKEISRDVRETVRNLRDELTWAVRESGRGRPSGSSEAAEPSGSSEAAEPSGSSGSGREASAGAWSAATGEHFADAQEPAHSGHSAQAESAASESAASESAADAAGDERADEGEQSGSGQRRGNDRRPDWREWADRTDWRDWADWARRQGWTDWAGKQDWRERARAGAGRPDWSQWTQGSRPDWLKGAGRGDRRENFADLTSDLEHLAALFAQEIRGVARHAENMGEDTVGNLGRILGDALNRIRTEVFRAPDAAEAAGSADAAGAAGAAGAADSTGAAGSAGAAEAAGSAGAPGAEQPSATHGQDPEGSGSA
ncbi:MAG TPA: helix-turn-helix transcriptional regulator [Streptosporangiaceae bacterium]|nr:helix-turn-helix transcriptional regulator [Streptosporangiaceae bacterium]